MKNLTTYINEWKANPNTIKSIEKQDISQYFIYEVHELQEIRIFNSRYWVYHPNYDDKVYVNGEHVELDNLGWTTDLYKPGIYKVEIRDINDIRGCSFMFDSCDQLISVPLFDISRVENTNAMFGNCANLKKVPLFDTKRVKNMSGMFYNCTELKEVPYYNTKSAEKMDGMFNGCKNIEDVPLFDVSNVKTMEDMFCDCNNLSKKTIQEWSTVYDFNNRCKLQR